jgi:hypothetical protein
MADDFSTYTNFGSKSPARTSLAQFFIDIIGHIFASLRYAGLSPGAEHLPEIL